MKRISFVLLLALIFCGCRRDPASINENQRIAAVEFSPDGQRVLTTATDGKARIWDVRNGQALSTVQSTSTDGQVRMAQFSPDGRRILTTSTDGKTRVWDVQNGQELSTLPQRYQSGTLDNMPIVGGDNFKVLQDQIDALEKRVRELETKSSPTSR